MIDSDSAGGSVSCFRTESRKLSFVSSIRLLDLRGWNSWRVSKRAEETDENREESRRRW